MFCEIYSLNVLKNALKLFDDLFSWNLCLLNVKLLCHILFKFSISYFSRDLAESSPYYEALKSQEVEVLFTYEENDEVVFAALKEFQKKNIVSAENYLTSAESNQTNTENEETCK